MTPVPKVAKATGIGSFGTLLAQYVYVLVGINGSPRQRVTAVIASLPIVEVSPESRGGNGQPRSAPGANGIG